MRDWQRRRPAVLWSSVVLTIAIALSAVPTISSAIDLAHGFVSSQHTSPNSVPSQEAAQAPTSFVFGAGGDIGANSSTSSSLTAVANSGASFFLAIGDLSYNEVTPESAWCDYVKQRVGATYPFELLVGNHEETAAGPNGFIDNYAACLPDRLGVSGQYAHQYYFDYPPAAPLARFILIDPALYRGSTKMQYCTSGDSANCDWLKARIDEAKSKGLWTVVGMHKNCITMGEKSCEIGAPLLNALVERKVDLILQGHDHSYQRSKQLSLTQSCSALAVNAYNAGCVVDDGKDNAYSRGAGTVLAIVANVGRSSYSLSTSDPEAPYFAAWMNPSLNSKGFLKFTVSQDSIDAQFVAGTGSYTDHFTIGGSASPTPTPTTGAATATATFTATPTPVGTATPVATPTLTPTPAPTGIASTNTYTFTPSADSYVLATYPDRNYGSSVQLRVDGSPIVRAYLRFEIQGLVDPVAGAQLYVYANSGSSVGYQVGGVADNTWTETGLTYNNAPSVGPAVSSSGGFASKTWTAADATALVGGNGTVNLALGDLNTTAISFSSRQGEHPPLLLVTTGAPGTAGQAAAPAPLTVGPAAAGQDDSDGDGLIDADELANGTDIHNPDTDGDGLPDLWEVEAGLNPLSAAGADGAQGDPDGDGVTNLAEFQAHTDPWEADAPSSQHLFLPLIGGGLTQ